MMALKFGSGGYDLPTNGDNLYRVAIKKQFMAAAG
jgi:hypothetical protein